ncbi:MAG TPA: hypothetical protein PKI11_18960 [Candidatus Hydrogenedentes bacterium]|nr:hypothetical protein [Candidatus Hydrogenedentota bacterium]HNT86350.1 hypothetical protein [Candidatus Hydrogenedentota bacterium]
MDVIVDGERNFEFTGEPADALAAAAAIESWLRERERAMLSIVVDGKSIAPDALIARLSDVPTEAVTTIEVSSAPVAELVNQCLIELAEALPNLPEACRSLAEVFHGETPEDGFEPFEELAVLWGHVKTRQLLIANALRLDLDSMSLDGSSLKALHDDLNAQLKEAAEALENGDCILLGDLLEYELAPRAEREERIVGLLRERAASAAG